VDTFKCHRRAMSASIRALVLATPAVCSLLSVTAHAQLFSWPHYRSSWGGHASFNHKHQHGHTKSELAKKAEPQDTPKGPLQIIISIADQQLSLYDNGALIARSSVSTGVRGHPTPLGVFSVISKERFHRSNIYSAAPMPYMQRITWSGIALHAGVVTGHPASHGCIRLTNDFAIRLWHLTKRGSRVIIARDDVRPVEIVNSHLFVLDPKAASVSSEASTVTVVGDNNHGASAANRALLSSAETPEATDSQIPRSIPTGVAPQKVVPISVFVSRKLGRLLVRKGFTSLFDVPVKIQNPEQPLGTHVFTAMDYQNGGASIRWTVVSLSEEFAPPKEREAGMEKAVATPRSVSLPDKANDALDRIEMPQEAIDQISQLLTPGASLIISDYGISHETGADTDFIVLMH
jgi:L,D-transpeptidase catalytic domain